MDPSSRMDKFLEYCVSKTLGQSEESTDTQKRRENKEDELEEVERGYRVDQRGEKVHEI